MPSPRKSTPADNVSPTLQAADRDARVELRRVIIDLKRIDRRLRALVNATQPNVPDPGCRLMIEGYAPKTPLFAMMAAAGLGMDEELASLIRKLHQASTVTDAELAHEFETEAIKRYFAENPDAFGDPDFATVAAPSRA